MRIYCDLDGVLCDFEKAFLKLTNIEVEQYLEKFGKEKTWQVVIDNGSKFWSDLEWMPDGKELWKFIVDLQPIICSTPNRDISSRIGKKKWCEKNLGITGETITRYKEWTGDNAKIILTAYKHKFIKSNTDILIDDREKNIIKWLEYGGIGILHKNTKRTIYELKQIF